MNATKAELKKEYERAVNLGWLPFFVEAAKTITNNYFDAADLLAIGSRETNLDPKWLKKAGDNGNGFGILQADRRSFPSFTKGDGWKDAKTGILFGAKVLMQKWADYENNIGKKLTVKSSKGSVYRYTAQKAEGVESQHLVLSSYNCGRWSQYCLATNQDIDKYSTGKDYGKDVMGRAVYFRQLMKNPTRPAENLARLPAGTTAQIQSESSEKDLIASALTDSIQGNQTAENVVQVPQSRPEIDEAKDEFKQEAKAQIKSRFLAIPAMILSALSALWERLTSGDTNLVYWLVGAVIVLIVLYVVASKWQEAHARTLASKKEVADIQLKLARESQAHALTLVAAQSAMNKELQTIAFAPNPIKNSDA